MSRTADIIKRTSENYQETVLKDYSVYMQGGYTNVTYFQINDIGSKYDNSLDFVDDVINTFDTVHSYTGNNTPIKYNKIENARLYGVKPLDIINEISERGLVNTITSTGVFPPKTIIPVAGEFFIFNLDDLKEHLFQVTDVQFSSTGSLKYYLITFTLFQENVGIIEDNVEEDFTLVYDALNGAGEPESGILTTTDSITADNAKLLVDDLIETYMEDYFDDRMNCFVYRDNTIPKDEKYLWSTYLQHFINKNSVMKKYEKKIMDAIWLIPVNKLNNPAIYEEDYYRESIFRSVELKKNKCTFDSTFMADSGADIRKRNLPFFFTTEPYKALTMDGGIKNVDMFFSAIPFTLVPDISHSFQKADQWHKFEDPIVLETTEYQEHLKPGDVIYHVDPNNKAYPIGIYYIDCNNEVLPASLEDMLSGDYVDYFKELHLFSFVRDYILGKFELTDQLMEYVKEMYFKKTLTNYIYLPILIYIIKEKIKELYN